MDKSRKFAALILVSVILSFFTTGLRAQEEEDETHGFYEEQPRIFYGGLLAGSNFSQVDGDRFAGYYKIGANVGGIVYAQLAKHSALSLEILYSQKGSKSNGVLATGYTNASNEEYYMLKYGINTNYAEIPVMINYFDKRKSHFGVGLSYSRLVSYTETMTTDPSPPPVDLSKYGFKSNNLDVLAGVQLHLVKGLFLNVRFQYSITPIRTDIPLKPYFSRSQQYNNLYVVRLMYLFI